MALLELLGRWALTAVADMGRMVIFMVASFAWLARPPFRMSQLVKQLHFIGYKSTLVVVLTAAFTGMVLALQGHHTLRTFGSEGWLGAAVAVSLIRELGPVLAALMVTARAGSAMTAEIGIMRITEQIDALETMAVNPLQYVIAPKLVAGVIGVPLLVAIFDVVGIYDRQNIFENGAMIVPLAELQRMLAAEEARGYADYGFVVIAGDPNTSKLLQRSPLARYPVQSTLPGLIGYFQTDAAGAFSTPLLPLAASAPFHERIANALPAAPGDARAWLWIVSVGLNACHEEFALWSAAWANRQPRTLLPLIGEQNFRHMAAWAWHSSQRRA